MTQDQQLDARSLAVLAVRRLYSDFDIPLLERVLAVGRQYEAKDRSEEVLIMNEALAAEIERKKAGQ